MKLFANVSLSIFFAIAIGVHANSVMKGDNQPFWWHGLYFITYGGCWWMLFAKKTNRIKLYAAMALFPFISHVYYAYRHFTRLDAIFWICVLTCVMLLLGFLWIKKATAETMAL